MEVTDKNDYVNFGVVSRKGAYRGAVEKEKAKGFDQTKSF